MQQQHNEVQPVRRGLRWHGARAAVFGPLGVTLAVLALPLLASGMVALVRSLLATGAAQSEQLRVELALVFLDGFASIAQLLATLLLVFLVESAVHEGGHLLTSRIAGFRLMRYCVGPLMIKAGDHGVEVGLNESWEQYGGHVICVPDKLYNLTRRNLILTAGGPLGSLTLGLVALSLSLTVGRTLDPALQTYLSWQATISLLSAVVNALPLRSQGHISDGARIMMLLKGGPVAERWCAITALVGETRRGIRPRNWDSSCIAAATALPDGSIDDQGGNHIAFYWALDRNDVDAGGMYIDRVLAMRGAGPAMLQPPVLADAAFYHAYFRKDPLAARELLHRIGGRMVRRYHYMQRRAEAAVLLAEGRREEARALAAEGWARMEAESAYDPGGVQLERDWFRALAG